VRRHQGADEGAGKAVAWGGMPLQGPGAIETEQTRIRAYPEIAVWRLRNGGDQAFEKPFADRPCFVRVLINVEGGIQCESARAEYRKHHDYSGGFRVSGPVHSPFIISFPPG